MAGFIESLGTVNSFVRTLIALTAVSLGGWAGWYGYHRWSASGRELEEKEQLLHNAQQELAAQQARLDEQQQAIASLEETVKQKDVQIQQLDTSLRLLKVNHRVARLSVLSQEKDPASGELFTTVEFTEVDDSGHSIDAAKRFRIRGDVVYIDAWVVKFDDKYIEQSDLDRSTSLVLFRRIFGESQQPIDGFPLDAVGNRPRVYGRDQPVSEFERKIWEDFWQIANDEGKARELGIRAAHGEAPSIKVREKQHYKVLLRASDGLTITPDSSPPPDGKPAA